MAVSDGRCTTDSVKMWFVQPAGKLTLMSKPLLGLDQVDKQ